MTPKEQLEKLEIEIHLLNQQASKLRMEIAASYYEEIVGLIRGTEWQVSKHSPNHFVCFDQNLVTKIIKLIGEELSCKGFVSISVRSDIPLHLQNEDDEYETWLEIRPYGFKPPFDECAKQYLDDVKNLGINISFKHYEDTAIQAENTLKKIKEQFGA